MAMVFGDYVSAEPERDANVNNIIKM